MPVAAAKNAKKLTARYSACPFHAVSIASSAKRASTSSRVSRPRCFVADPRARIVFFPVGSHEIGAGPVGFREHDSKAGDHVVDPFTREPAVAESEREGLHLLRGDRVEVSASEGRQDMKVDDSRAVMSVPSGDGGFVRVGEAQARRDVVGFISSPEVEGQFVECGDSGGAGIFLRNQFAGPFQPAAVRPCGALHRLPCAPRRAAAAVLRAGAVVPDGQPARHRAGEQCERLVVPHLVPPCWSHYGSQSPLLLFSISLLV